MRIFKVLIMDLGENDFQFPIILSLHQYFNKWPQSKANDVTTPNSNGEILPVYLHNQLLIILSNSNKKSLSNSNKKYLASPHVGNCYLKSWFLSWSRQQSSLPACAHRYKNVLICSAGWNWRLWSTLKSDFTIIKVKIKLKDKWSVLKTLSIIPLGQAVSMVTEQFYILFNGLLQGRKRNDPDHSLVNSSLQPTHLRGLLTLHHG